MANGEIELEFFDTLEELTENLEDLSSSRISTVEFAEAFIREQLTADVGDRDITVYHQMDDDTVIDILDDESSNADEDPGEPEMDDEQYIADEDPGEPEMDDEQSNAVEDPGEPEMDDEPSNANEDPGEPEMDDEPSDLDDEDPGEPETDPSKNDDGVNDGRGKSNGNRQESRMPDQGCAPIPAAPQTIMANGIGSQRKRTRLASSRSISKVPLHIREIDEKAYTPRFICIGPFHHIANKSSSISMENEKRYLLKDLLDQAKQRNCTEETIRNAMRMMEPRARKLYSGSFPDLGVDEFVEMMVLDGCFIVQLFRLIDKTGKANELIIDHPIFSTRWKFPNICRDLLMLENQLPYFVLEKIYKLTRSPKEPTCFHVLAQKFCGLVSLARYEMNVDMSKLNQNRHEHLLGFFQSLYGPSHFKPRRKIRQRRTNKESKEENRNRLGKNWVDNATTLRSAGISFRHKQTGNLLDIEYSGSLLRIPTILAINENNGAVLKNLLVYEQCCRSVEPHVTNLVMFLCSIAVVPEDIKLLREARILQHNPAEDQMVVDFLGNLSRGIECAMDDCVLIDQVENINKYCLSWVALFHRSPMKQILAKHVVSFVSLYISLFLSLAYGINRYRNGFAA